jgi:tetratricopeptide (TPR) repeat protein
MAGDTLVKIVLFLLLNLGFSAQVTPPPVEPPVSASAPASTPTAAANAQCTQYAVDGSDAINRQAYADAIARLETAVRDCPDDSMLAQLHGVAAYKQYEALYNSQTPAAADTGYVYLALGELSRAIMLDPTYSDSHFYRGLVFAALGETEHALIDYAKAIEIKPESPYAFYARASLYERTGDKMHAIADYQRFLQLYTVNDSWRDDAAQRLRGLEKPQK